MTFQTLKVFFLTLAVFLVLDFLWLGVVMPRFYKAQLGPLARLSGEAFDPIWPAALAVYLLLVVGIVAFVLPRATASTAAALGWGALFGVVCYGVYDFTNLATLRGWPGILTAVDIAWGGVLCGATAVAARLAQRWVA
jgi:uncharacterized membrane protein